MPNQPLQPPSADGLDYFARLRSRLSGRTLGALESMFEYHGWAVLRWAGVGTGNQVQMTAIRLAIESARSAFSITEVATPGNDLTVVYVHGARNHRGPSIERLFAVIAQQAPESYGLLYVRDDEDPRGLDFENCFRVWRLARGEFSEMADPFLSPCIPAIELPYDPATES